MCNYPWSNRDTFDFVTDCHIYQPVNNVIQSFIVTFSLLLILYATYETFKLPRKALPVSSSLVGIFFLVQYSLTLSFDISFADRNVGIALLHGLGRSQNWISMGLYSIRHLEVVINIKTHTSAKKKTHLRFYSYISYVIFGISFLLEVFSMVIPTLLNLRVIFFVAIASIFQLGLNAVPFCFYAWKLRKILIEANEEQNATFYAPIIKQLSTLIVSTCCGSVMGLIFIVLWIYGPQSLYLTYNLQMLFVPLSAFWGLIISRGKADQSSQHSGSGDKAAITASSKENSRKNTSQIALTGITIRGGSPDHTASPSLTGSNSLDSSRLSSLVASREDTLVPCNYPTEEKITLDTLFEIPSKPSGPDQLVLPIWNPYLPSPSTENLIDGNLDDRTGVIPPLIKGEENEC